MISGVSEFSEVLWDIPQARTRYLSLVLAIPIRAGCRVYDQRRRGLAGQAATRAGNGQRVTAGWYSGDGRYHGTTPIPWLGALRLAEELRIQREPGVNSWGQAPVRALAERLTIHWPRRAAGCGGVRGPRSPRHGSIGGLFGAWGGSFRSCRSKTSERLSLAVYRVIRVVSPTMAWRVGIWIIWCG